MHFVLIPFLTRHTNSVISLSNTSFIVWKSSANGSFLSIIYFCLKTFFQGWISHHSIQREQRLREGSVMFPATCSWDWLACTQPFCFQGVVWVLLTSSHNSLCVCMYLYTYIYTHTCVAVAGSLHSTLMLFGDKVNHIAKSHLRMRKCRNFIVFSVNSGVNGIFPCL